MCNHKLPIAWLPILLFAIGIVVIISLGLNASILSIINKRFNELQNRETTTTVPVNTNANLVDSIRIEDLINHLKELQSIASDSNNTRAIGTIGYKRTVNYIFDYLKSIRNFNVWRQEFSVKNFTIKNNPILVSNVNVSLNQTYSYSNDLAKSDFTYVINSAPVTLKQYNLTLIENNGCMDFDWSLAKNQAALVMAGGSCTYSEKSDLANKFGVAALIFYNNGLTTSNLAPAIVRVRQSNTLPALFLSYSAGQKLAESARYGTVKVWIQVEIEDYPAFIVENVCADTNEGNANETIVIGSHSDSVPAGPGINDNGSGTATNLVLATNLARLYNSGTYKKYAYRVRFCWWGAEEIGLVGSIFHAQQAQNSSAAIGNKLSDYLINLNYDMVASPNFMFGIYDGRTAKINTPPSAKNASIKISEVFRDWFIQQNLPWDYTELGGRSDYGPFLAAGVAAGGLFTGADGIKTSEQRLKYERMLGPGRGGLTGAIYDPCYHKLCDSIDNIDQYAFHKMAQGAAYMLEYLGSKNNLQEWLYPRGRTAIYLPESYYPNYER